MAQIPCSPKNQQQQQKMDVFSFYRRLKELNHCLCDLGLGGKAIVNRGGEFPGGSAG